MSRQKEYIFFLIFTCVGFLALQVKLTHLAGSRATFTLFDAFAPIAGAFLGTIPGILSVLIMQFLNFLFHGSSAMDVGFIIRLVPMMFAVIYFSKQTKLSLIVPLIAMIAFLAHPIGQTVWFYSLFWIIPLLCYPFRNNLIAKSFGATFTAHAVGGALWIWAFNLPAQVWIGLIPIVIIERSLFALGIVVNYKFMARLLELIPYLNLKQDPRST